MGGVGLDNTIPLRAVQNDLWGNLFETCKKKNGRNEILRWAGTLVRHLPDGNDLYRWKEEEMAERKSTTKTNGGAIV